MRPALAGTVLVALVTLVAACGGDQGDEATSADTTRATTAAQRYDGTGPRAVGVRTLDLGDELGRVTVWYPAAGSDVPAPQPDAAVAGEVRAAPLLVFAHGSSLEPGDYEPLLSHVASWGVVVAAPARGRGVDLVAVGEALRTGRPTDARALTELLDDSTLVVGGHSRGTTDASSTALDDRVSGAILLAGGGVTEAVADGSSPLLFVAGGNDGATESWVRPNVAGAEGPHQLVVAEDAGHLSFTVLCQDGEGVQIQPNDCTPPDVDEESVQPLLGHSMVAFVRWRAGLDDTAAALDAEVLASFGTPVTVEGGFDGD